MSDASSTSHVTAVPTPLLPLWQAHRGRTLRVIPLDGTARPSLGDLHGFGLPVVCILAAPDGGLADTPCLPVLRRWAAFLMVFSSKVQPQEAELIAAVSPRWKRVLVVHTSAAALRAWSEAFAAVPSLTFDGREAG